MTAMVKFGHPETFAKPAVEPGSGRRNKRSATTVKAARASFAVLNTGCPPEQRRSSESLRNLSSLLGIR